MKPNGRRAWRRWCKRARLRMNSHHRALYRSAIMRKKQPERTPMPLKDVKPLTARSLVGMSQSSRKRRRWEWVQAAGQYDAPGAAKAIGAKLRIGERLRPCPGCSVCQPCYCGNPSTCIGLYDSMYVHDKPSPACDVCCGHGCEDGHCYKRDDAITCDGSGVIPARKAKR